MVVASSRSGVTSPTVKNTSIIAAVALNDTGIPDSGDRKESSTEGKSSEVVNAKSTQQMRSTIINKPLSVSLSSSTSNVAASSVTSPESSDAEVSIYIKSLSS
jgi:hypothetical protein